MKALNDYLWKGVLEETMDDFLRFMHPKADDIFDFSKGIVFLDKELQQLFPSKKDDDLTLKIVDKLAKVYTRAGKEEWILIHCEVQKNYSSDFPRRMYHYYSRILEKYNKRISAYAILTGSSTKQRSNKYISEFLGTKLEYCYNVYQIALQSESELMSSDNPFAKIVLIAHSVLQKGKTVLSDASLLQIKLNLLREFVKMQMPEEKIRSILKFLVTYIRFENSENEIIFDQQYEQITEGKQQTMGIMELYKEVETRRARQEGKLEGIKSAVLNMLRKSQDDIFIADFAGVPIHYVQQLRAVSAN